MAQTQTPFLSFFLFFSALLLISICLHISPAHAIRQKQQKLKKQVFSVSLHPLVSITNPDGQSNPDIITESQVAADFARAKYINSRISRAISLSNSNSSGQSFQTEDLQAPITMEPGGGAYAARIGVGTPANQFDLVADTGSDVSWLRCSGSQNAFDPSTSSSFQQLSCDSKQCVALGRERTCSGGTGSTCDYELIYGAGSDQTAGVLATETLSFGSSGSFDSVAIGCGLSGVGFRGTAGILGLGGSPLGLPSQFKATSLSYCLDDGGGSSTLDFNSVPPGDSVTVPFFRNPMSDNTFYYVKLTGITIGQNTIQIPASVYQIGSDGHGGVIVDSGTTLTLLDSAVYGTVRDTFRKHIQAPPVQIQSFETCYDVPSGSASDVNPPTMSFQFSNGETLTLPLENCLTPVEQSTLCLPFGPSNVPLSIIGNKVQKGMRVTYDLNNNVIGFSPNKC